MNGTLLFQRTINGDYPTQEIKELMISEWTPTPWMIDVYTGYTFNDGDKYDEIAYWCFKEFGRESSPMHGREGDWRKGNVTMRGWTWFGFKTKDLMEKFKLRWFDESMRAEYFVKYGEFPD